MVNRNNQDKNCCFKYLILLKETLILLLKLTFVKTKL